MIKKLESMVAILNGVFMERSTHLPHKEMYRKFHVRRPNKRETGSRRIVRQLFLVVYQTGSQ